MLRTIEKKESIETIRNELSVIEYLLKIFSKGVSLNKQESYIYGLLITDGSMYLDSRNRGKVTLEVTEKDRDIVEKLVTIVPNSYIHKRERDTNFKKNYKSVIFANYQLEFRQFLIECGFPAIEKTIKAASLTVDYDQFSFWRGCIDGDGSLGFAKDGSPYISFCTKSEYLKKDYCVFLLSKYNIKKNIHRNQRDNIYNILVKNEEAIQLAQDLYLSSDSNLYLDRKYNIARDMQQWVRTRPKASPRKSWTKEEDDFILTHNIEESMQTLDRTHSSIKNRLFRLKNQ